MYAPLAMHIHPTLTIVMDGQVVPIPTGIGHPGGDNYYPLHTHDSTGIIHVESTVPYDFNLGDFFLIWGQPFNSQQLLGFHGDASHPVTMFVNNMPSTAYGSQVLQDGMNIVLYAGGPGDANQRWVAQVYQDLFHHGADAGSLNYFTFMLDAGYLSRSKLVSTLQASPEYIVDELEGVYQQFLGRNASPQEVTADYAFLAAGGKKEQLEALVIGSQEYFVKRGGNTATGFVSAVFHDVLGRSIDAGSVQTWGKALNSGLSLSTLAGAIIGSAEAESDAVQGMFQRLLHRPADPGSLAGLVAALQQGVSQDTIMNLLLSSDEYFSHV